jgi:NAD(P)-dependent dehydrogenase (short-subunit alcohol dehydrogenase family)
VDLGGKCVTPVIKKNPTRRVGQPNDLADAVLFLMQNGFTTGTVLHVDGGHRLI